MQQIYQDLVPSDSEVYSNLIIGGGATVRVVKVLEAERWPQWVFGQRIEPLGPNAKISVACGREINGVAVGRELRLIVMVPSVGYRDPFRLAGGRAMPHRRDQYLSEPIQ